MNKKLIWGVVIAVAILVIGTYGLKTVAFVACYNDQIAKNCYMDKFPYFYKNNKTDNGFPEVINTSDWKTYTNEKYGFSLAFPPTWNGYKVQEEKQGVSFGFDKNSKFSRLMYIGKITKAEWEEEQKSEVHAQFLAEKDGIVFTYSTANGDPEAVNPEIHVSDFDKIFSTFKFTSPAAATSQPSIKVVSPNGGENWKIGETYVITFAMTGDLGSKTVKLNRYSDDGVRVGSEIIGTTAAGSFSYKVPVGTEETRGNAARYKIQVLVDKYNSGMGVADESDNYFTITN